MRSFTKAELEYLKGQRLGRLATVSPDGAPQNNPVGFHYNPETGSLDIFGRYMGATRKWANIHTNPRVALVVDDIASIDPWRVRGMEIRGEAEAMVTAIPPKGSVYDKTLSNEIIRIHPRRIISWGIDPTAEGMHKRNVAPDQRSVS